MLFFCTWIIDLCGFPHKLKHNPISFSLSNFLKKDEWMNTYIQYVKLQQVKTVHAKTNCRSWDIYSPCCFLSDASSQTSWTSNQPTWRIWQRWSQRLSSTPITVTCLSIAAAKAPCASVTWGKQHCVINTPNVSKPAWNSLGFLSLHKGP